MYFTHTLYFVYINFQIPNGKTCKLEFEPVAFNPITKMQKGYAYKALRMYTNFVSGKNQEKDIADASVEFEAFYTRLSSKQSTDISNTETWKSKSVDSGAVPFENCFLDSKISESDCKKMT